MPKTVTRVRGALGMVGGLVLALLASSGGAEPSESRLAGLARDLARAAPPEANDLPARPPRVTLYAYDVHELLGATFDEVAAETSAIFEEMGVEVAWRRAGYGTTYGNGASREIPIIVLNEPPGGHRSKSNLLGLVPKDKPAAVWVFVANVRRAVGLSQGDAQPSSLHRLAVALGRVIAHEVVHTLAPELPHTKRGLMRDTLDTSDLTGRYRPAHEPARAMVRGALANAGPGRALVPAATGPFAPRY